MDTTIEFLKQLWADQEGHGLFCTQSKSFETTWAVNHVVTLPGDITLPVNYSDKACFFSPAVYSSAIRRKSFVASLKCVWCDVDMHGLEENRGLIDQQIDNLLGMLRDAKLDPNWLVRSGRGVHFYWVLESPLRASEWTTVSNSFNQRLRALDVGHDEQVTTDSARWLRLPGSVNGKCVPEYPVSLERLREAPWSLKDLSVFPIAPIVSAPKTPKPVKARQLATLAELASACNMIGQELETHGAGSPEPLWRTMLIAALFTEHPERSAYELSRGHAEFDSARTQAKLEQVRRQQSEVGFGFPSCSMFRRVGPVERCDSCPARALVEEQERVLPSELIGGLPRHTPIDQVKFLRAQIDASVPLDVVNEIQIGDPLSSGSPAIDDRANAHVVSSDLADVPIPFSIKLLGSEEEIEVPGAFVTSNGIFVTTAIDERSRLEFLYRMKRPQKSGVGLSFSSLRDVTAGLFLPASAAVKDFNPDDTHDTAGYLRIEGIYNDKPKTFDVPIIALHDARKTMKALAAQHVVVTQDRHLGVQHLLTRIVELAQKSQHRRYFAERMGTVEVPILLDGAKPTMKVRGFCYGNLVVLHTGDMQRIPPGYKVEITAPTGNHLTSTTDLIELGDREASIQLVKDYLSIDPRPEIQTYFAAILGGLLYHLAMPVPSMPLFHLWGRTGVGKTTATTIGASMLAKPDRINPTTNRTLTFTVELCSGFREIPTFYEEMVAMIANANRRGRSHLLVDDLFYLMSGGSRGRMIKSGSGVSDVQTWRTVLFTSSNMSILESLTFLPHEAGAARAMEIELMKLSNAELAAMDAQVQSCAMDSRTHCGWIGPELIKYTYANYDEVYSAVQSSLQYVHQKLDHPASRTHGRFVAAISASALEAAKLSIELFKLPFNLKVIESTLMSAMHRTLAMTASVLTDNALLPLVQQFIKAYSVNELRYRFVNDRVVTSRTPANGRAVYIEWNTTDNLLYVDFNEFNTFLHTRCDQSVQRALDLHTSIWGSDNGVEVVKHALGAISGFGTPGYSKVLKLDLSHRAFSEDVPHTELELPSTSETSNLAKLH